MLNERLFEYSAKLPIRLINRTPGERYLERYYLGKWLGFTAYLHRFVSPDGDEEVHDHPWHFALSLILCGGYREERMTRLCIDKGWVSVFKHLKPWRLNVIRGVDFHRIRETKPETWSLFIHRPTVKPWGFLKKTDEGTCYHQPFDAKASRGWYLDAPLGAEVDRAALNVMTDKGANNG